jgi:anaerobic selenocysteine-containing dehydrogenase
MANPVRIIGEQLAIGSSRRDFLALLGKAALAMGAILAGLGSSAAYASCGQTCPTPTCCSQCWCQYYSCGNGQDIYIGCCQGPNGWFETRACADISGQIYCYYVIQTTAHCPNQPIRPN